MSKKKKTSKKIDGAELAEKFNNEFVQAMDSFEFEYNNCEPKEYTQTKTATNLVDEEILLAINQLKDSSLIEAMVIAQYIKDLQQIRRNL